MNDESMWFFVRKKRNAELKRTDHWCLTDNWTALSDDRRTHLTEYRHSLREIPQDFADPSEAIEGFPTPEDWLI